MPQVAFSPEQLSVKQEIESALKSVDPEEFEGMKKHEIVTQFAGFCTRVCSAFTREDSDERRVRLELLEQIRQVRDWVVAQVCPRNSNPFAAAA